MKRLRGVNLQKLNRLYKEALEDFVKLPFAVVAGNCGNFVIFEN